MSMDLNEAGEEDLLRIPQFNIGRVRSLLKTRKRLGRFETWDDVREAPGFSDGMIRRLQQAGVTIGRRGRAA